MLVVNDRLAIPLKEFRFTYARSSGPGGQNVNKVNSKVTMHWPVNASPSLPPDVRQRLVSRHRRRMNTEGEMVIISQRFRDQARNVADCLSKLREMLDEAAQPPTARKKTKTPRRAKEKRLREKRYRSEAKQRRSGNVE